MGGIAGIRYRQLANILTEHGWLCSGSKGGSHRQFKHPDRPGEKVSVPHCSGDMAPGTVYKILRQVGICLRQDPPRRRDCEQALERA